MKIKKFNPEAEAQIEKLIREYRDKCTKKAQGAEYCKKQCALPEVKLQRQKQAKEYYKRKKMEVVDGYF